VIVSYDLQPLPLEGFRGSVVSIGVFDGVHLGHQAILEANVARARELGLRPTVVTFRHHPKAILLGRAPRTLTTLEHRLELFRRAGVSHTLALAFDQDLRDTPADTFVKSVLVRGLGAEHFVLGFDSKFGRGREGGPALLRTLGYPVEVVPMVVVDQRAVSSTAIREAVELGDLVGAARMLGRPVAVLGEVVRGQALGRTLGFPTANLDLQHELHPPPGVYACRANLLAPEPQHAREAQYQAVVNIGYRPTVGGERPEAPLVEAHLLDFEGDLYGRWLELEFVARLRGERRFDGLESLKRQISTDVEAARAAF
jgi:riboflavin kinase / FMN adenylyltransferase